jgi:hypothetical protein
MWVVEPLYSHFPEAFSLKLAAHSGAMEALHGVQTPHRASMEAYYGAMRLARKKGSV